MYIHYQERPNGLYASIATSIRKGKKVDHEYVNLGRVLDKDKNIYRSRARGVFHYDLETNTYSPPPDDFVIPEKVATPRPKREPLIVNFGGTYVLDILCRRYGIKEIVDSLPLTNKDSFMALLYYYIEHEADNCFASDWFEGDLARLLFPKADLSSFAVEKLLKEIGNNFVKHDFFKAYFQRFPFLIEGDGQILFESTELPNPVHFSPTALCQCNGYHDVEGKVAYATQVETGIPVYFQYDSDNVSDGNGLANLLLSLKKVGADVSKTVFDAGTCIKENFMEYFGLGIDFLTRLSSNLPISQEALKEADSDLENPENAVRFNNQLFQVRKIKRTIDSHAVYLYVVLDWGKQDLESKTFNCSMKAQHLTASELLKKRRDFGKFVLLCSRDVPAQQIVPYFFRRQNTELLLGIPKKHNQQSSVELFNEETLCGHLLLTFISAIVTCLIQQQLLRQSLPDIIEKPRPGKKRAYKEPEFDQTSMFQRLNNHKCCAYTTKLITAAPYESASEVYSFFRVKPPKSLSLVVKDKLTCIDPKSMSN